MKLSRRFFPPLVVLSFLGLCSCSPVEPMERKIEASTSEKFANWRARNDTDLTPEQLQSFNIALQEIKLDAMDKGAGSMAAREEKARAAIAGKSVREALVLGWQDRRARLEEERKDMQERYDHDSRLKTKPDDAESAQFLSNVTRNEVDMLAQRTQLIDEADKKLSAWGASSAAVAPSQGSQVATPSVSPAETKSPATK